MSKIPLKSGAQVAETSISCWQSALYYVNRKQGITNAACCLELSQAIKHCLYSLHSTLVIYIFGASVSFSCFWLNIVFPVNKLHAGSILSKAGWDGSAAESVSGYDLTNSPVRLSDSLLSDWDRRNDSTFPGRRCCIFLLNLQEKRCLLRNRQFTTSHKLSLL